MLPVESPILEVHNISKSFPGVRALSDVNLTLNPGEVLAVIGENGAGKSTLMKVLAGVQQPDRGEIRLAGRTVHVDSTRRAMDLGIVLIHQELNLASNLDIGANIYLGREPRRLGLIDRARMHAESTTHLNNVGLEISSRTRVDQLTIGRQQLVEIAKALSVNARVLIMDEPTSSLSARETQNLFRVVKDLRSRGVGVIYISHRLGEVRELADRVLVLRDGKNAGELTQNEIEHDEMVRLMVGRDVSKFYARSHHEIGETVLEVTDLATPAWPEHRLNFQIRAGEIVGLAGLVGAGRTELLRVLFGVEPAVAGTVQCLSQSIPLHTPRDAIRAGVALVPEDRKQHGLVLDMSVQHNVGLPGLWRHQRMLGFANQHQVRGDTVKMIDELRIRTPSVNQTVQLLSGGNQQKVVVGKWLALGPKLFLLDEPTRGIDVGAKEEIYRLMEQLARDGMAILFASSEMEEILGMSDRTLVMHEGRISGELTRDQLSEEAVMQLATGGSPQEENS